MPGEHARLAPSGSHRWIKCPASVLIQAMRPEQEETEAQLEGTVTHLIAAKPGPLDPSVIGTEILGMEVTDEMYEAACEWKRVIPDHANIERRVGIPAIGPDCWGTPDANWWDGNVLHLADLKFGHRYVDEFENWQLLLYVLGLTGHLNALAEQTVRVEMTIFQPRAYVAGGAWRTWSASLVSLRGYFNQLISAAEETRKPNPHAVVGSHCHECRASTTCNALQEAGAVALEISRAASPFALSPKQLGRELKTLHAAKAALEARYGSLIVEAELLAKKGNRVPGWELKTSSGREKWTEPSDKVFALGDMFGVELRRPPAPLTPNMARGAGIPDQFVATMAGRGAGKVTLVPCDDKSTRKLFGAE